MAKQIAGREAEVTTRISKEELVAALRAITLENQHFNSDIWSLADARDLMNAGAMIRREILLKDPRLKKFFEPSPMSDLERGTETCSGVTSLSCRSKKGLSIVWWCEECLAKQYAESHSKHPDPQRPEGGGDNQGAPVQCETGSGTEAGPGTERLPGLPVDHPDAGDPQGDPERK